MKKNPVLLILIVFLLIVSCGGNDNSDGNDEKSENVCEKIVVQYTAGAMVGGIWSEMFNEEGEKIFALSFQFWKESEEDEDILEQRDDIYDLKGKTIKLGESKNADYNSCRECVLLSGEPNDNGEFTKFYFATSGTLVIEDAAADSFDSKGKASLLHFSEIDLSGNSSVMVENGKCYEIESFEWNTIKHCEDGDGRTYNEGNTISHECRVSYCSDGGWNEDSETCYGCWGKEIGEKMNWLCADGVTEVDWCECVEIEDELYGSEWQCIERADLNCPEK